VTLSGASRIAWYKGEAAFFLKPRLRLLAEQVDITYTKVSTREARRRWGSCSSRGNISLNCKLILTPEWVSDSIILHELAHRIHHNHSKLFWNKLLEICPRWNEAAKWLEMNYVNIEKSWYSFGISHPPLEGGSKR
jgi:predicted metal-dependent hydrolase